MKPAAGCILRGFGNKKELSAKVVAVKIIIGYKVNGNGSIQNVDSGPHYTLEK
jgi:hypothetical protein